MAAVRPFGNKAMTGKGKAHSAMDEDFKVHVRMADHDVFHSITAKFAGKVYALYACFLPEVHGRRVDGMGLCGKVQFNLGAELAGQTVEVDGAYPIDISQSVSQLLRFAQHNEYEEYNDAYKYFGEKAREEGFFNVSSSFCAIAEIEKSHGDRFGRFADLLEQNKLFVSDVECKWMCLNCGHIHSGIVVPDKCPVCKHDKGYFIRLSMAPYENIK